MRAPPIVPKALDDEDSYLVLDDFGARIGRAWSETAEERSRREHVIVGLIDGQYSNPVRVVAFNAVRGWSRDVSEELAELIATDCAAGGLDIPPALQGFIDRYTSGRAAQLALPLYIHDHPLDPVPGAAAANAPAAAGLQRDVSSDAVGVKDVDASRIEQEILNFAKIVPGCENFAGVIVGFKHSNTHPESNWEVLGVKFGAADRVVVSEAIATIVSRLQQQFRLVSQAPALVSDVR
jgi:hypothetical protein